jgi:hydrogenase maturation factor
MNTRLLNSQPWRFIPGDTVFVRGWPVDEAATVLTQLSNRTFPHYLVADSAGIEWRVAQLQLSSKPIITR